MKPDTLENVLRGFRQQMLLVEVLRIAALLFCGLAIVAAGRLPAVEEGRIILAFVAAGTLIWILTAISATRLSRQVQTAAMLLNIGKLDEAEVWLGRALRHFSLSVKGKILAVQQLAALYMRREAYPEAVSICRSLLARRLRRVPGVWVNTRIMLGDGLLHLDRASEAYEAIRPVYDVALSLVEQLKLLPVQLRYELSAGHNASATRSLKEKVEMAELLDPAGAALVHALLAEACRRQAMSPQYGFLMERACLYYDLDKLARRYGVLKTIVTGKRNGNCE